MLNDVRKELFMTILLINNNPIVSRLFALCQEEDVLVVDEFPDVASIGEKSYDIIFVDEPSYLGNVASYMVGLTVQRKVIISYRDTSVLGFDETIKKPFLPSQIMNIIDAVKALDEVSLPILSSKEIDTIKELLVMDEEPISSLSLVEEEIQEEEFSLEELALLEASIKETVLAMKSKKIKNFLKGKPIKIKIQLENKI